MASVVTDAWARWKGWQNGLVLVSKQDDGLRIAEEAATWLDSLDADYSKHNRTQFVIWLKLSAAHVGALLRAAELKWEEGECPARNRRGSRCRKRDVSDDE